MNRRGFFASLAALPLGAMAAPAVVSERYPNWRNYTFTYVGISNAEMIERLRRAKNAHFFPLRRSDPSDWDFELPIPPD